MIKRLIFASLLMSAVQVAAADNKNWSPPATKIYAQQLSDETMKAHPELLSFTLHGVPLACTMPIRCSRAPIPTG